MLDRIFKFFCSLRLTVALLGLGLVLVFVGTLAQVHEGLYDAQVRYFKSWTVWRPTIGDSKWPIILPGGYLLGIMLLLNLLAAHIKRFRFTWKKLGIHLIHGGLVLLLLGQLLTDLFSHESYMRLAEGSSRSYSEDARANELALVDLSDPKGDRVTAIPESVLAKKGEINDAALPVTLRVLNYWPNADIEPVPPSEAVVVNATAGVYTNRLIMPLPESSTAEDARAATLVEVVVAGKSLGTFLVLEKSDEIQTFAAGGQELGMSFLFAPMLGGNVLAISPTGNANLDNVETFSDKELARKGTLASKKGAFTLNVKEFWPKCRLYRKPQANSVKPKANHGMLAAYFVTPEPVLTDTDSRNMPSVEVELMDGKNSLGIWLLWTWPTRSNEPMIELVKIGGRDYQLAFEFKRYYAPYQLGLIKFTQDKYKGTDVAKNFSSRVRLQNSVTHEDREVLIKMNTPLRYAGTTYYQASFHEGAQVDSVLEVVTNPGWLTPYLACLLVGAGLVLQFATHLFGFMFKRKAA